MRVQGEGRLAVSRGNRSAGFQRHEDQPVPRGGAAERGSGGLRPAPGEHRVAVAEVDATTGNAALVVSESAPAEREHYVRRALEHVQGIGQVLSLESTEPAEYVADEHVAETSSHAVTVHPQQQHKGIPIFQATQAVRFAPDGALTETGGSSVPVTEDVDALPGSRSRTPRSGRPGTSPSQTQTRRARWTSSGSRSSFRVST